jgi:hypothetical protein
MNDKLSVITRTRAGHYHPVISMANEIQLSIIQLLGMRHQITYTEDNKQAALKAFCLPVCIRLPCLQIDRRPYAV